jgi:FKBP-type peptidyl-prolyl cis-trans isomerase
METDEKMLKKTLITWILATAVLLACNAGGKSEQAAEAPAAAPAPENGADPDASYALGMAFGLDMKQTGMRFNYGEFLKGFEDTMEGRENRFSREEAITLIQGAFSEAVARRAEENKGKETVFLAENGQKTGVQTTSSGLQYEVLTEGTGPRPGNADTVEVHYEGSLIDGTVFDSSYERGAPAEFPLNQVITGWAEGIQLMPVGSVYRLFIPSGMAYGESGAGEVIPPNSTLIFKVELLSILPPGGAE